MQYIHKPEKLDPTIYYYSYINLVNETCALQAVEKSTAASLEFVSKINDDDLHFAYAPGKWSMAQVLKHICDAERVYAYRLLRLSRKDKTSLPGFDENNYVDEAPIYNTKAEFIEEFSAIRQASVCLLKTLKEDVLDFEGYANNLVLTPRIITWLIAGHNVHHLKVLEERYLIAL